MTAPPLNTQQLAVVDWILHGEGSLNLIARAGCGKTFTLLEGAVRAIIEHDLGEVLFIVFNKANADEAKVKIALMGKQDARFNDWRQLQASTCHSVGFAAWRKVTPDVKVDDKKVLKLIDDYTDKNGAKSVWAQCTNALNQAVSLAKQAAFGVRTPLTDEHAWFNLLEHHAINDLADGWLLDDLIPPSIEILRESIRKDREVVDFNDMILAPLLHKARFWPKDWILLDEAQDTNTARRALALAMLKPRTGRLIAVGDDRQAIYGFTGADSDALDLIANELGSTALPLTVTYRCPKAVVKEANKILNRCTKPVKWQGVPDLVAHETAPEGKVSSIETMLTIPCRNCGGSGRIKKEKCPGCIGSGEGQIHWFKTFQPSVTSVILCRNVKPLIEQAYGLLRAGIGCRVEGREIGQSLIKLATRWKRIKTLPPLSDKLEDYQEREVQKWLAKGREERAQGIEDRCQCLQVLITQLQAEGKTDLADLVAFLDRLFGDTTSGNAPDLLTLSTIHKAKGREWDTVYLLDRANTLPSRWARKDWQLHQEENLEYVAVTRAKRELVDLVV